MRRAQQRHHRPAREVRGRAFEHHVDGRGVRLGGERQGVERFERNARAGKHFAREIEIRQRPRHDEADAIERRLHAAPAIGLDAPRHAFELVLAIAIAKTPSRHRTPERSDAAVAEAARLSSECLIFFDLDKRQPQPIEVTRSSTPSVARMSIARGRGWS